MKKVIGTGNRKAVRLDTKFGMLTYAELAYKLGYENSHVRATVKRFGVDVGIDRLETGGGPSHATVRYNGKELSIRQVEDITGFSYTFIRKAGMKCANGDVTNYIKNIITERNTDPSVSMIKAEEKRMARVGTVTTSSEFARCAARSN